jgi:hypothetical protein
MSSVQSSPDSHSSQTSDLPAEWLQVPLRRLDLNEQGPEPDPQEPELGHTRGTASGSPAQAQSAGTSSGSGGSAASASGPGGAAAPSSASGSATTASAGPQGTSSSSVPTQGPQPHPGNVHSYAVWRTTGQRDIRGVHVGGNRAWQEIVHSLPNAMYAPTERLRRLPSEAEAVIGYAAEARRHGAPMPPPRFYY